MKPFALMRLAHTANVTGPFDIHLSHHVIYLIITSTCTLTHYNNIIFTILNKQYTMLYIFIDISVLIFEFNYSPEQMYYQIKISGAMGELRRRQTQTQAHHPNPFRSHFLLHSLQPDVSPLCFLRHYRRILSSPNHL
jgi:hypothetical protein